jgi:hypothetical protein
MCRQATPRSSLHVSPAPPLQMHGTQNSPRPGGIWAGVEAALAPCPGVRVR